MTQHGQPGAIDCVASLKVLADGTRLAVVRELMGGTRRVGELEKKLDIGQSLLSHHLKVLRDSGIVTARRTGKSVVYSVAPGALLRGDGGLDLGCCTISFDDPRKGEA